MLNWVFELMNTRLGSPVESTTSGGAIAVLLARVVVPLWLLAGAVLKLMDASPNHLPVPLIKWAGSAGIDLLFLLRFSIAAELTVVGVMWLLPRLARPVGLVILGAFLPVLIGEVLTGASSCGCFGSVQVHPGITLTMDLGFFLGLWWLGRDAPSLAVTATLPTWRVVAVGFWTLASFALAFGLTATAPKDPAETVGSDGSRGATLPADGYYLPVYADWIGLDWDDVPISSWIEGATDIDAGPQYILFYRKDCEHCHELMEVFFAGDLAVPTTAVSVPEKGGYPSSGLLDFVCEGCRLAELPVGVDWFLQTPVLVRLTDGVVQCAAEVTAEDPQCIEW